MPIPANLDHLVYVCDELEEGIARIGAQLGTAPVRGGSHPKFGTCNALLSLGDTVYLEVLAPDPAHKGPAQDAWLATLPGDRAMATWVMRTSSIDSTAARAREAGAAIGRTIPGSRALPDGSVLEWQLSEPFAMPFDGVVPFLIDWGNSPHPAMHTPHGGTLTGFAIHHPRAKALRNVFAAMGVTVEIIDSAHIRIEATIEGAHGAVTLS